MPVVPVSAQHRADMAERIKRTAKERLRNHGLQGFTLRAVASDVGLTPGALYRYFTGLEDLLSALVTDAYDALAEAVHAGRDAVAEGSAAERFVAAAAAYRDWAIAHPDEFRLLFGDPIPGYQPTPGGDTTRAAWHAHGVFIELIAEAHRAGSLTALPAGATPPTGGRVFAALENDLPTDPVFLEACAYAWSHLHGAVTLEIQGHLTPLAQDLRALFVTQMTMAALHLGL